MNDGGPAFPRNSRGMFDTDVQEGLSSRAYFAGHAMAAILSSPATLQHAAQLASAHPGVYSSTVVAMLAVEHADALIAELSKEPPK